MWLCMAQIRSILEVASYHCIMCFLVMSMCIELGRWESHITIRSALKPGRWECYMTIPECSCGLCRRLLAATVLVQHRTLPEEIVDMAYALHCGLSLSWKCIWGCSQFCSEVHKWFYLFIYLIWGWSS